MLAINKKHTKAGIEIAHLGLQPEIRIFIFLFQTG